MKNQKILISAVAIIAVLGAIYYRVSNFENEQNTYEQHLADAREFSSQGLIPRANESYANALNIQESLDVRLEVGQMYVDTQTPREQITWAEDIVSRYPNEARAYSFLLDLYVSNDQISEAFTLYDDVVGRDINSQESLSIYSEIEYSYETVTLSDANQIRPYKNGYWMFMTRENSPVTWSFADAATSTRHTGEFEYAGPVGQSNLVAARPTLDDQWGYYNVDGEKVVNVPIQDEITYLGTYQDNHILIAVEGNYSYYNSSFEPLFGPYENATEFVNGFAFIQDTDGLWYAIDGNGQKMSGTGYEEIYTDTYNVASLSGMTFARNGEQFHLLDYDGNEYELPEGVEDVKPFYSGENYAAVRISGLWGFVDKEGQLFIEPTYVDADSFSHNMATVQNAEGLWGIINEENFLAVPYSFYSILPVNERGVTIVSQNEANERWQSLTFFKDNH